MVSSIPARLLARLPVPIVGNEVRVDLSAPLRAIDRFQRPRPWLAVPLAVTKRFGEAGAGGLAAAIAYYGFFSLFPLMLVLASLAGFALHAHPDLQQRLLDSALAQFPVVGAEIRSNVGSIQGSGVAVAVGLVLAVWAGLGAIRATQVAMDTVWDVPRKRRPGTPASIGLALVMLLVLGVFLVGAAVIGGVASGAGRFGMPAGVVASLALNIALFALMYRILTRADVSWRSVAPGAVLAGIGWTALLALGGHLVSDRIGSSAHLYGSFAVVIGLLGWIYLGAQLALAGAVLNPVLADHLWPRSLTGELTGADRRALRRSALQEERTRQESVDVAFEDADPATRS
jgi:membrane protein